VGCVTSSATVAGVNSIQGAVNSAGAGPLSGDHCVAVGNGTYNEQIVIQNINTNGFRIYISSAAGATVTVSPPVSSEAAFVVKNASVTIEGIDIVPTSTMTFGIAVSSPSVVLSRVTIPDTAGKIQSAGLFLSSLNTVSFSSVTVSTPSARGLELNSVSSTTMNDCYISNLDGRAVFMVDASYNTISQSTVTGGGASQSFPAFYLGATGPGKSSFNTISKSRVFSPTNHAVQISYGPHYNTISQSTLISDAANSRALELTSVASNTITQSFMTASAGSGYGLMVFLSTQTTISQSTITGGQFGLYVDRSSGVTVSGSYAEGLIAAFVRDSTGTVIDSNDFTATTGGSALRVDNIHLGISVLSTILKGVSSTGIKLNPNSSGLLKFSSLTVSGALYGFDISAQAPGANLSISSITFQNMASGGTAVYFTVGNHVSTFTGFNFADTSIATNVNGASLAAGSRITMKDPLGPRSGSTFENDPSGYVDWPAFGITPLPYNNVSAGGLTANWSTSFSAGTIYYLRLSTDSFATVNSSNSTTNSNFVYAGLNPSTSYRVRVSTMSSGTPFTDLGLITTPAVGGGSVNFNFSGSFGGAGGAAIASAGGQNEIGQGVIVDKVSGGGPYVYVLFESTTGPAGAPTSSHSLAKYGNAGTLISSRALTGPDTKGAAMALDNDGNLYVGEKDSAGPRISKFDPSLNLVLSVPVPAAQVDSISGMISEGGALYTINDGGADNTAKLIKYDFNLVALATAAYPAGGSGSPVRGKAVAMDVPGNFYVVVASAAGGAPARLLKYPSNFNAAGPDVDVAVPGLLSQQQPDLAYSASKVLVGFADASGANYYVKQFDSSSLNFTGVVSTVTGAAAVAGQANAALRAGPDGSVFLAGTVANNAGDYFVMKYDVNNLTLLSSATFNSPTYLQDRATGLAVASSTEVYVTGASSNTIADVNAVTVRMILGGAGGGSGSIFASSYTGVSPDSLTANWGTTFPGGTLYYLQISTNGFTTINSSNTTTSTNFIYTGLSASLSYEVRVSTVVSGGPYTFLGSVTTLGTGTSISGAISYGGLQPGAIRIEAFITPGYTGAPSASQVLSNVPSQSYYLPMAAGTYYLRAYVDVLGNANAQAWADQGTLGPITVGGSSVTGQNFAISVDSLPPERPVGLSAAPTAGQVYLTWAAPTTSTNGAVLQDLRGFVVQRSSGGSFDNIGGTPAAPLSSATLTFIDFAPVPSVANSYRVIAVDFGQNQSPPSPQVSVSGGSTGSGGTITGNLSSFTVTTSGTFRLRLSATPNGASLSESNLASYSFSGLSTGTYYLKGFRDLDENGLQGSLEPAGTFGGLGNNPYPVYIFGTSNIIADATLCDRSLLQVGSPVSATLSSSACPARDAGPDRFTNLLAFEAGTGSAGSVSTGTPLVISMTRIQSGAALFDSQLMVFGPSGQIIASNSSPGGASVSLTPLETGVYVVEPTSFYGFSTGTYSVTMNAGSTGSDPGQISGQLTYSGSQGGNFVLRFFANSSFTGVPLATMTVAAAAGSVSLLTFNRTSLPLGTYSVDAFRDTAGTGFNSSYQAYGSCSASVALTQGAPTANIGNCTLFDPAAASAGGSGVISGSLEYRGSLSGTVRTSLFFLGSNTPIGFSDAVLAANTATAYSFGGLASGTYLIKSFVDSNNNFIPDADEATITSPASGIPLLTGTNLTGQNFTLCDRRSIFFGAPITDFWTASDCPAPDRAGAYMRMYTFSGTRGQPVTIEAAAIGFYGSVIALYDPKGNLVASDDGSANAGNAKLSGFELPLDGLYSIGASPYSANVTGQIKLSLMGSGGDLGSISGSVVYSGNQGGQRFVGLFNSPAFSPLTHVDGVSVSSDSTFSFYGLITGTSYYLGAFVDVNLNFIPDPEEDKGIFGAGAQADPILLQSGQNLSGVSIVISPSTTTTANASYVSGSIGYSGGQNIGGSGQLRVEFWSDSLFQGQPVAQRSLPNGTTPYAYDISVPGGQSYFIRAFLDINNNMMLDSNEPKGVYAPYGQGAENLYVPFLTTRSNVDFSISDPGLSAAGGGVAGEGTAAVAPLTVAAGSVFGATITYTAGPGGIQSASGGGRIGFILPSGFPFPQSVTVVAIDAGPTFSPVTFSGFSSFVTVTGGSLSAGQKMKFILNNMYAPCVLAPQDFTVVSAKDGTSSPQPLFSISASTLTMAVGAGSASFIGPANPYFSLSQGQLSDVQRLEARDNCGNKAPVAAPVATALRAKSYNFQTGQFDLDGTVGLTLSPAVATAASLGVDFAVGQSSRNFYVVAASTGFKNIEIFYNLAYETTFYSGFTVLPGNALSNATVSTAPFASGKSSATISQNSAGILNPAFINFTLGDTNYGWHVLISSVPFRQDTPNMPLWETWGYGQPSPGQVVWDGRYSPWINNGLRVPNGLYYIRIEVGGSGVKDDSLLLRVDVPQVRGRFFDAGVSPRPPLSGARIQVFGPNGAMFTEADADGNYALPGLGVGLNKMTVSRDDFLEGSFNLTMTAAGAVSTFTADSSNVSASLNSFGGLDVLMNRAPVLLVTPSLSVGFSTQAFDQWGSLQVCGATSAVVQQSVYGPLRLRAGTTTFDDGGQWDPASQQFVTRTLLKFKVAVGTYTVEANFGGFARSSASVFVPVNGASLNLPPFTKKATISGQVSVPSNLYGSFVSVNAVPLSTAASAAGGFGGVYLTPGALSAPYTIVGLDAGSYVMRANAQGFSAVSMGPVVLGASDVTGANFPVFGTGSQISGTATIGLNTPAGRLLTLSVNAWSPGSMNFGSTQTYATGTGAPLSMPYVITGLDAGATYQIYTHIQGLDEAPDTLEAQPLKVVTPGTQDFSFIASSGVVSGSIQLPAGSTDFANVFLFGRTVESPRPEDIGREFVQVSTSLPNFRCEPSGGAAAAGYCPVGESAASFRVTGLKTETLDMTLFYKATGETKKFRLSVVNGATTTVSVNLAAQTYSISGSINNQITNALFNTNPNIVANAPFSAPGGYPAGISSTTARLLAVKQDISQFRTAISEIFDPATTRVGFLSSAGLYMIGNVPSGVYFVRTENLRSCATCSILVPSIGKIVRVNDASVSSVTFSLSDGYNISGQVSLDGGLQDSRVLELAVRNRRQEVVRSTSVYLGDAALGLTANAVVYSFTNLPANDFYTLSVRDATVPAKYAGKPIKFPDPGLSPNGLQSNLTGQNLLLQRAAFLAGKLKDASTGELIGALNAGLLAPNFRISATANPWVEGGFSVAVASVAGRPIEADDFFRVGPLIPNVAYDLRLAQTSWDPAFLARGSQNYSPVQIGGLTPTSGEVKDVGVISLNQGQQLTGTLRQGTNNGVLLGNIKVVARPSTGDSGVVVQTYTNPQGRYTLWVSTFLSNQFDVTAAPRDGNLAANGSVYGEVTLRNVNLLATTTADFLLTPLLASVTGQVVVEDAASGGELSFPFGANKGFPAAAINLQPKGVVPLKNPLGDIEAVTEEGGKFSILALSTGTYLLKATSLGYSVFNATVAVSTSASRIFTGADTPANALAGGVITLARGATLTGRILKSDGSAPNDSDVGSVAAANFAAGEFVVGSVDIDQVAKTVNSYTISGFKPGVSYDVVILPKDKSEDISFPSEGDNLSFAASESTATKSLNLTFAPSGIDCRATSRALGNGQFQVKIDCTKGLRNTDSSDNDLDALLTLSTYTSAGAAFVSPNGTGQLLGSDKALSTNRRRITAIYRTATGEAAFSLRLRAYSSTVDPATGSNFAVDKVFDFFSGVDSTIVGRVANINGGSVEMEPSAEDELLGLDERSSLSLRAGTFAQESDPTVAATTISVSVGMRKGKDRQTISALHLAKLGYVPASLATTNGPATFPAEMAAAMQTYRTLASTTQINGANPLSSFYDIFLPAGIRHQLKENADLTLSYDLTGSSSTSLDGINVWFYDATLGRFVAETSNRRLDPVNKTITVSVDHFSIFVVLDSTPVASRQNATPVNDIVAVNFPNPSDCITHSNIPVNNVLFGGGNHAPFQGTMIRFSLPGSTAQIEDVRINVYNLAGELVRTLNPGAVPGGYTHYVPWNCANNSGQTVGSGVYIGEVVWGGKREFFKMAIIKGSGL
jgi:hypothetical protein